MARYRTIKPEFFSDGSLSECCRDARFLFVGLLPFVDDMGRRRYSAKQLKNEVFPGDTDIDAQKVGYWFQQLVKAGVVELYQIGSIQYFRLPNFLRHQRITHPTHTDIPQSPTENGAPQCLCDECKKRFVTSGEFQRTQESSRIRESSSLLQNSPESSHPETDSEKERGNDRVEGKSAASAHCCWFQEPGEMHWQFLCSKDQVTVEVIRFDGGLRPGRHGPDGVSVFKAKTPWIEFARQVLGSMLKARDLLAVDGYNREWGHPFPKEACDKLGRTIHESNSGG